MRQWGGGGWYTCGRALSTACHKALSAVCRKPTASDNAAGQLNSFDEGDMDAKESTGRYTGGGRGVGDLTPVCVGCAGSRRHPQLPRAHAPGPRQPFGPCA